MAKCNNFLKGIKSVIFVIFFANGFYCFGSDNCCKDCCEKCFGEGPKENSEEGPEGGPKENSEEGYKESSEVDSKIKACVNEMWLWWVKELGVLMLFKQIGENKYKSENKKITITIEEGKIKEDDKKVKQLLKLGGKKYALFEIKYKEKEPEETIYLYCSDIESVKIFSSDSYGIFYACTHTEISVIACDITNVKNMSSMFRDCQGLTELNLGKFNTGNIKNMNSMFNNCKSLTDLNISNFDTQNVIDMGRMFCRCEVLKTLDLSNFNTQSVIDMGYMFFGCKKLKNITLPNKFGEAATKAYKENMFVLCEELSRIYRISDNDQDKMIKKLIEAAKTSV